MSKQQEKKRRKKIWVRILIGFVVAAMIAGIGVGAYYGTQVAHASVSVSTHLQNADQTAFLLISADAQTPAAAAETQTAKLHAADGTAIATYTQETDGRYTLNESVELPNDSAVTIVGTFDSAAAYTLVMLESAQYFVQTNVVQLDTAPTDTTSNNIINAIAISLMIITVALGAIVFCLQRRSRLTH